ncbi:MAG: WD40/YVTN/BNR-like repeat-containing protein [Lewinella sp.]|uniref:WD40/YVTN/BNR-like repeat-containing protein n=1 Tax=Lewinella sp. TaxID=2004506 RepID=UPI003D6A6CAC
MKMLERNRLLLFSCLLGISYLVSAQSDPAHFQSLEWRNIGPANMMGRIADIDALSTNYRHVICASASGGVFQSKNGGITWDAIFDDYGAGSIGSVALHQAQPEIIWVGTGESANRNSSGWGDGLYKSTDGGQSFVRVGFEDSHHIADIALHPTDPDIAYVAVVGHLWGYSGERGLYKTIDGGDNWEKLTNNLPQDGKTGCTEVVMHPEDTSTLFAGFYHRLRQPFYYTSGGEQGGLFKSTDSGKTWIKLTEGLPTGAMGMIDISICKKYPNILVAAIEADENLPKGVPGSGVYRSDDGGDHWRFMYKHAVRPFYHGQIEIDPSRPDTIYVVSRDFQISYDGGETFKPRRWRTDGGDDHAMWIAPYDSDIMYLGTDQGLRISIDGGATILSYNNMAIGQYYAIGADMQDPYWVGGGLQDNGLWVGPSNSRERRGILNEHNTWVGEGDGFHFQVDPTDWRTTYLVNHVGFAVRINRETRGYEYITPSPQTISNYRDHFDPKRTDPLIEYTIDPGEHWFFYEETDWQKLPPQFRFNWSSPLVLSPTLPQRVYFAGNHLFRSDDRGKSWRIISPDLTSNDPKWRNPSASGYLTRSVTGGENHFTIVTTAESPMNTDVVWAGTDDGYLHVTRDGGHEWKEVGINLPEVPRREAVPGKSYGGSAWVSRVEPSRHQPGRCYVTLDNHRYDDMQPYVFVTEDYGETWEALQEGLPKEWSCYVVREDPQVENLLFVGTETAVHFSLDRGKHWQTLRNNMPRVAIHDLIIHPREGDLIAGTHGRSIWILDDLSALRALAQVGSKGEFSFLPSRRSTRWQSINTGRKQPYFEFRGENPAPGGLIQCWVAPENAGDSLTITVKGNLTESQRWKVAARPGLNRIYWDLNFPPVPAIKDISVMLETIDQLRGSIEDKTKRSELAELYNEFVKVRQNYDEHRYLELWDMMSASYGRYGYPLGKRPRRTRAEAGHYAVEIDYQGQVVSGQIELRDDPILDK